MSSGCIREFSCCSGFREPLQYSSLHCSSLLSCWRFDHQIRMDRCRASFFTRSASTLPKSSAVMVRQCSFNFVVNPRKCSPRSWKPDGRYRKQNDVLHFLRSNPGFCGVSHGRVCSTLSARANSDGQLHQSASLLVEWAGIMAFISKLGECLPYLWMFGTDPLRCSGWFGHAASYLAVRTNEPPLRFGKSMNSAVIWQGSESARRLHMSRSRQISTTGSRTKTVDWSL